MGRETPVPGLDGADRERPRAERRGGTSCGAAPRAWPCGAPGRALRGNPRHGARPRPESQTANRLLTEEGHRKGRGARNEAGAPQG